ncbi:MAG TPA: 2-amino-4-hydroxy-6-hydroxymethyldihydropteridine diphosphokinase [Gammaproteobacteria bacterium]|nr:2-amino-4-hydroxy-6-hydroxymethyldihydropteridine diphosphokinase [Gammaproteobacteria bacterium]
MAQVYVSIGSNIARERNIARALVALAEAYGELQQSSVYESAAVGFDSAPFYNLVVGFRTDATPQAVQATLHDIEDEQGRLRAGELAARTLDLDLLLYDERIIEDGKLVLPRADIVRYAFVLGPLAEIAAERRHPVNGRRYADLWSDFDDTGQELRRIDWPPAGS